MNDVAARAAFDAFYADGTPYSNVERAMFQQVADAVLAVSLPPGAVIVPAADLAAVVAWFDGTGGIHGVPAFPSDAIARLRAVLGGGAEHA